MKLIENVYFYEKPGMGPSGSHTYVIVGDRRTLLIDPGFSASVQELADKMRKDDVDPQSVDVIVNTHLHLDHSDADEAFAQLSGAWIALHVTQEELTQNEHAKEPIFRIPITDTTYDNEIDLGGLRVNVIETPGHCQGHVCFYLPEQRVLITGDMIFEQNVGRVDLPSSNDRQAKESLKRIAKMDVDVMLPAHGKVFLTKDEVKKNMDFVIKNLVSLP